MSSAYFFRQREDGNYDYIKQDLDDNSETVIQVMTPTEYQDFGKPSDEDASSENRSFRDSYLAETDWWCLSDRTPTAAQLNYRQALRDITSHENWPHLQSSDWPTKPS